MSETKPAAQKPTIGRQVRFTRIEGEKLVVRTATISAVRPAVKAEEKEVTGEEREKILASLPMHRLDVPLDGYHLVREEKSQDVKIYRRFPRGARPELVDLHVLVPVGARPVELVEGVPYDAKGEQDVSWSWPARE